MNLDFFFIYMLLILKDALPFVISIFTFGFFYLFIGILIKDQKAKIFNSIISLMITVSLYFATIFFCKLSRFDYFFDFVTVFLTKLMETSIPYTLISIFKYNSSLTHLGIFYCLIQVVRVYLKAREYIDPKLIIKVQVFNVKEYIKGIIVRIYSYIGKVKSNMINIIIDRNIKNELCTFNC